MATPELPFGTIFRVQLRPGVGEESLRDFLERWHREMGPRFPGTVADMLLKVEGSDDTYHILHLFPNQAIYRALAADASQDQWYRELLTILTGPPEFTDVTLAWQVARG